MTTLQTRPNRAAVAADRPVQPLPVDEPVIDHTSSSAPADSAPSETEPTPPRWRQLLARRHKRTNRQAAAPAVHLDEAMRMLHLVQRTRGWAFNLTVLIAMVSFVLSFTSLQQLAAESAWPGWKSWLWPAIIDGLIILATVAIVALAPYPHQFWNRAFLWLVLATAALVSTACNGLHAWLAAEHLPMWMRWGSAALACTPPVGLLATTHILAILWRFNPTPPPDETSQAQDRAAQTAEQIAKERAGKWAAAAIKMHEMGLCTNHSTATLITVLGYLYEHRPTLSLRAIGGQPEVDLHHSEVSKIRDGAKAALGVAAPGHDR
jgi:Protein of unknown function (DUF2637)